ncbi:MAG: hypothetical protein LBU68_01330 [Rickettsiales bacterium]|jgi:FMN phosphatase YigB (HAD superfamily)|nr:hypothetical protein [Rickettsiales bacterium]
MKVLIIDKDGVLNPPVAGAAIKWGFKNMPLNSMLKFMFGYVFLKKFDDSKMEELNQFFVEEGHKYSPSSSSISAMVALRNKYDKVVLATNGGAGEKSTIRVHNEVEKYYPPNTFDEIVVQGVKSPKTLIYQQYVADGHDITVIDDSRRHIKSALSVGVEHVVKIGKKKSRNLPDNVIVAKDLAEYAIIKEMDKGK